MPPNPYKFEEPLDPGRDKLVCISRKDDMDKVIGGLIKGDYWAVLGPENIGKTTFLHQVKTTVINARFIYLDFETVPTHKEEFYRMLKNLLEEEVPAEQIKSSIRWWRASPELKFFNFLERFKPKDDKQIVLMFDEIDKLPFAGSFLRNWRKIFIGRNYRNKFNRYAVIITGNIDLIALTQGPTSPFNIAKTIYMRDFSAGESETLIVRPMTQLSIEIEPEAKKKLIDKLAGHPQLLQHACHLLVEKANASNNNKVITEWEVNQVFKTLLELNKSIQALNDDVRNNPRLEKLIMEILAGKKKLFYPYKEWYLYGAGAVVNRDSHCDIRSDLYREFLKKRPGGENAN
jgi:predicted component of type VI protein secretion system